MPLPIIFTTAEFIDAAKDLAAKCGCTAANVPPPSAPHLWYDAAGLIYSVPEEKLQMRVDYLRGPTAYRLFAVGQSHEPLLRALGLTRRRIGRDDSPGSGVVPYILDAGAGLGRDGLIIAAAGAQVLMCERSPIMAALLTDGLARAADDPQLETIIRNRLTLHTGDAKDVLATRGSEFAAVYFDPMFPHRNKTALVKKEMRLARLVSGDDSDAAELLALARTSVPLTVVKRPLHAELLAPGVTRSIKGTRVRYDVYSSARNA